MRALQPCGTVAAYKRHLGLREVPDDACRQAHRQAQAAWRKRDARKRRVGELHQQALFRSLLDLIAGECRRAGMLP
jgi:hypothetical protein